MSDKIAQTLRSELARIKADKSLSPEQQKSEIEAEIKAASEVLAARSGQDPEAKGELSGLGKATAGFATAFDAATLGVPSLLGDVVTAGIDDDQSFTDVRAGRKEAKRSLARSNPKTALALEVGGSVLPAFVPGLGQASLTRGLIGRAATAAPKGAARRTLARAAQSEVPNLMAQGAVAGGIGELGDGDEESVLGGAAQGAVGGAAGAAAGKVLGSGARLARRVWNAPDLEKAALNKVKDIKRRDAVNYGVAKNEASSTKPIAEYLEHDPIAGKKVERLQRSAAYRGQPLNDAETAMETFKRLSADERGFMRKMDSKSGYEPEIADDIADIRTSKDKLLSAVEEPSEDMFGFTPGGIPSLRKAIGEHAKGSGELNALIRGADIGRLRGSARKLKGAKLGTGGSEAFQEFDVPKMTQEELKMALTGVLGGGREAINLSGNPITAFNIIPSAVRTPLYAMRNRKLISDLERRLGMGNMSKEAERVASQALARLIGAGAGR